MYVCMYKSNTDKYNYTYITFNAEHIEDILLVNTLHHWNNIQVLSFTLGKCLVKYANVAHTS